ncbi:MAG: MGMT family protein [Patescibacteria group bacterium]|jgi:methylated-DNA-protein-cysteine methyltransferase-like protein
MSKNFYNQVYFLVKKIPRGKVATYGQIAALIGSPRAAQMVGWAMHAMDGGRLEEIPWQRVINREGRISTTCIIHPPDEQARLLKKDGVQVLKKKEGHFVDLKKYLWQP